MRRACRFDGSVLVVCVSRCFLSEDVCIVGVRWDLNLLTDGTIGLTLGGTVKGDPVKVGETMGCYGVTHRNLHMNTGHH